jgi:ankyrin repeat protein
MDTTAALLLAAAENDTRTITRLLTRDPALAHRRGRHPYWGGKPNALEVAIEWGNREAIGLLLDAGADPNESSEEYGNWRPLLLAIQRGRLRGRLDIANYLVERGAKVDAIAAAGLGMADYLRDASDLDVTGPGGTTPLHWAATVEVAQVLLDRGADPAAADRNANLPERNAAGDRPAVARLLLSKRGALADIHLATAMGDGARVQDILDTDPDAIALQTYRWDSVANFSGGMPLHIAAIHGRIEVAALLLERGADVNARCLGGATPLHYTSWKGQVEMATFLLDHGADLRALDPEFQSPPVGWAKFQRWPGLVALLSSRAA